MVVTHPEIFSPRRISVLNLHGTANANRAASRPKCDVEPTVVAVDGKNVMRQSSKAIGVIGFNSRFIWRVLQCLSMERQPAYVIAHAACSEERVYHRSRYCLGITDLDLDELAGSPSRAAGVLKDLCEKL